ncbi:hypothetical protein [Pantoea sp. 1.19]|uniref:hypothetical protein n=1 Tax=Pantoea sp. 1.19 TaxID=1925589 RepID=UPI00111544D1|nr:hypothetical protein [Pantoea sp. 1.19]
MADGGGLRRMSGDIVPSLPGKLPPRRAAEQRLIPRAQGNPLRYALDRIEGHSHEAPMNRLALTEHGEEAAVGINHP